MKIIKPITIEAADITSNNLTESASEYSSSYGSTYDVDDLVKVTGTGGGAATATHRVYKCLKGANANISNCQTDNVTHEVGETLIAMSTSTGSGGPLTGGSYVWFENDPNEYPLADGTSYSGGSDDYLVLASPGLLQALPASQDVDNSDAEDFDPTLYPDFWEDQGAVNNMKPFDETPLDQATRATSLAIEFDPDTDLACNAVAIINMNAENLGIKVESGVGGTLYDTTPSDTESIDITTTVGTWYEQFFSDDEQKSNHAIFGFNDSNSYSDLTVTVEMSVASGDVAVGQIVVGPYADIGTVEAKNISIGLQDNSQITINEDLNRYSLTEGSSVQVHRYRVFKELEYWPEVKKVLESIRNTVCVFVPDGDDATGDYDHQGEGIIMGFLRDWRFVGHNGGTAMFELEVLGLH